MAFSIHEKEKCEMCEPIFQFFSLGSNQEIVKWRVGKSLGKIEQLSKIGEFSYLATKGMYGKVLF